MLTADLVRAYRRKGELKLRKIDGEARARAVEVAEGYCDVARRSVGDTRREVHEGFDTVPVEGRDRKLADGLRKLVLDRCDFEVRTEIDPVELRQEVFQAAARWRREQRFDREALLAEGGAAHEVEPAEIERLLYADLKGAHRLLSFEEADGEQIMRAYELGQVQAVLLRAEAVEVEVEAADPALYRALFRKMKFHRLLHTITKRKTGGYRIGITGPFSLFSSVTKYGLQLALVLPAVRACDRWSLTAEVRWGKERTRARFEASGKREGGFEAPRMPDEVEKLAEKFRAKAEKGKTGWEVAPATEILSLPGVGECVPDLVFRKDGQEVFLEVLGYWSRAAVWKRVELVEAGMDTPIVFAVSKRLRVSEEVLPEELPAALYVYKGVLSAKAVEERLDRLAGDR